MSVTTYTHDAKGHRTDVHRPSVINPGDYEYIGVSEARKLSAEGVKLAGPGGVCHHCGKAIVWSCHYRYLPTGDRVTFGFICAGILDLTDNRIDHEMALLKRRAENERRAQAWSDQVQQRNDEWWANYPTEAAFVQNFADDDNGFINFLRSGIERFGSPLPSHIASLQRFIAGRERMIQNKLAEAKALENAPAITEGRYQIEGTILSTKWKESDYGDTLKMVVQSDSGNKVWGTVPNNLINEVGEENLRGTRISFKATIKPSEGDDHFGYVSRPTNAKVVS
jgi:hypothetical protein